MNRKFNKGEITQLKTSSAAIISIVGMWSNFKPGYGQKRLEHHLNILTKIIKKESKNVQR